MNRILKVGLGLASVVIGGTTSAATLFEYTGPAVAIPDLNSTGISVTVAVSGLPTVGDLNILFTPPAPATACTSALGETNSAINHTFTGDLEIDIRSPAGTTVTVMNDIGGTRDNICDFVLDDEAGEPPLTDVEGTDEILAGRYRPLSPLSAFDGQNPNGNWTITIRDDAAADTGSLRRVGLQFETIERRERVIRDTMSAPTGIIANRIFRDAIPSICDDKVFPGVATTAGMFHYKAHTYTNPLNRLVCVPFELQTDDAQCAASLGLMAYRNAFNPADIAPNYAGDSGNSASIPPVTVSMLVPVAANASVQVIVYAARSAATPFTNCPYHINVGLPALFDDSNE